MTRPRYEYTSAQDSVLRPYYQRFIWNPWLELIPPTVAPNTLTLIALFACGLSFVLAATASHSPVAMVIAAVGVFVYLSLDNMDGAQARRARKSSRLGEFLDHWLDTCNNGFVTLGACLAAGLPPLFSLGVLGLTTLAFYAVQWELRQTGVFRMGRVADIEGNTAVASLYLLIAVAGPGIFAVEPIAGWPPLSVWLGLGVGGQALWTLIDAARRVPSKRAGLLPITIAYALLLAWSIHAGTATAAHLTIAMLANPVFTSRPVLGRLLGQETTAFDWTAVALLALGVVGSLLGLLPADGGVAAWVAAALFAVIAARHAGSAIFALKGEPPVDVNQPAIDNPESTETPA